MKSKIIVYDLSKLDHYHKVLLNRAMFGFIDNSNNGAYRYSRKGILEGVLHKRLMKGALIAKMPDAKKILAVLKQHKANVYSYNISVKPSMLK